jgi:flagellin-like hook-associated protein FlgL
VTRGRLREIDHGADTLRDTLAVVGSRSARLDSVRDHLSDAETQIASLLGRFEGVDLTEAAGRLAQLELGYEATLTVSARLLSLNNLLSII